MNECSESTNRQSTTESTIDNQIDNESEPATTTNASRQRQPTRVGNNNQRESATTQPK
jgi:hypothetical protein